MNIVRSLVMIALLSAMASSRAQSFPENSEDVSATALKQRLGGKVYTVKLGSGATWRLEYKETGYFFINTSSGFEDSGEWTAQDGKLCSKGKKIAYSCNEVRAVGEAIYMKRDNGEIVQFVAK